MGWEQKLREHFFPSKLDKKTAKNCLWRPWKIVALFAKKCLVSNFFLKIILTEFFAGLLYKGNVYGLLEILAKSKTVWVFMLLCLKARIWKWVRFGRIDLWSFRSTYTLWRIVSVFIFLKSHFFVLFFSSDLDYVMLDSKMVPRYQKQWIQFDILPAVQVILSLFPETLDIPSVSLN